MQLSHTKINSLLSCARQYKFRYIDRLEPISRPTPLTLGAAFHKAIEKGDPKAGVTYLEERPAYDQSGFNQRMTEQAVVSAAAGLYLERWGIPDVVEESFSIELGGGLTFTGTADGVEDMGTHLMLIENKFVGNITEDKVRRLSMDRQIHLMAWALHHHMDRHVREVSYRFVRKPSIRLRKGEELQDYIERIHTDYADRPDFYATEEELIIDNRQTAMISQEVLDWFEYQKFLEKQGHYPRNTSNCQWCDFKPLCLGDPDARSLFQEREKRA